MACQQIKMFEMIEQSPDIALKDTAGQTTVVQYCPRCLVFWGFGSAASVAVGRGGQTHAREHANNEAVRAE